MSFSAAASRLTLAALLSLVASFAAADTKTLATVDGQAITDQDVDEALADIGANLPEKMDQAARRKYALDYLIDLKLVARQHRPDPRALRVEVAVGQRAALPAGLAKSRMIGALPLGVAVDEIGGGVAGDLEHACSRYRPAYTINAGERPRGARKLGALRL